jgi:hypothetical protein
VTAQKEQHMTEFLEEMGFTIEQATGQDDELPIASVAVHPYEHKKPFITDEEFINLPTQMHAFHKLYLERSKVGQYTFGVKYRHHDFFHGDDDFWIDFEHVHAIYRRDTHYISLMSAHF